MELAGQHVTLEPLEVQHADELWPGADDEDIRRYWPVPFASKQDLVNIIDHLNGDPLAKPILIRAADGSAAGATSFYDIDAAHKRASIGWTFILKPFRRTAINTETKLLLLGHIFDEKEWNRVQFDVDSRNDRSQTAVLRLGAQQDGILRKHKVLWDGYVRDTVVFSIVSEEWPAVKQNLLNRLT